MTRRKSLIFPDVDLLLPLGPGARLKVAGFSQAGRNFIRVRDETVDGVYFRTSKFGASTFQVVASVFHARHHELISGRPFPANPFPGKAVALVQRDVPCFLEDGSKSPWWQVLSGAEIGSLATTLAAALEGVLPFFESWSDPVAVRARLSRRDPIADEIQVSMGALSSLLALSGDILGASAVLRESALPPSLLAAFEQRLRAVAS
jgi:hypothetical protein